jgi:hypothetical protein
VAAGEEATGCVAGRSKSLGEKRASCLGFWPCSVARLRFGPCSWVIFVILVLSVLFSENKKKTWTWPGLAWPANFLLLPALARASCTQHRLTMGGECKSSIVVGWKLNDTDKLEQWAIDNKVGACDGEYGESEEKDPAKRPRLGLAGGDQCLHPHMCWMNMPAEAKGLSIVMSCVHGSLQDYECDFFVSIIADKDVMDPKTIEKSLANTELVARGLALAEKLGTDKKDVMFYSCPLASA